ncbi:DUF5365 family protein [Bacillus atrophaeus]|uniref:DUF5365 family protein n=1 Tax=Bacillus atrophaeus TaxID=1452 RepID=UPI00287FF7B4|nr:DUF5365 family protein [Bacillus atrophaeus]MDS9998294.1 YhcU family protein [Bacillus atrophaeus]
MARKVIDVRIVNAATEEQESFINELTMELLDDVFPLFFSELDIQRYKKKGVLSLTNQYYQGTLKEAFQIMACLQMIHTILTKPYRQYDMKDQVLFDKNSTLLNECGMFFPFALSDFQTDANQDYSDKKKSM